jgi:hypothetical protein
MFSCRRLWRCSRRGRFSRNSVLRNGGGTVKSRDGLQKDFLGS